MLTNRVRAAVRAFKMGSAVVTPSETAWGIDPSTYGPTEYGEYLSKSNGIFTVTTLRADLLASLPLKVYRTKRDGNKEEVTKGNLVSLLSKVNPFWTMTRLLKMTEQSLCLWGRAYWMLERGQSGLLPPKEIWWARPDRVLVHPHPEKYISHYSYRPSNATQDLIFSVGEVIEFLYPNSMDEFMGLAPLAAARLAADYASAGMKSNMRLFENGMLAGGFIAPPKDKNFSKEQAHDLETAIERRFRGQDKAHRWGVLRHDMQVNPLGTTARDAEFIEGLRWSLEDICRAYRVPLDLVGGQRTYENFNSALEAIWTLCLLPEARDIATTVQERLLPMFPGEGDEAEFDSSEVSVLQDDENAEWTRKKEQIEKGVITVNEYREEKGLEPVEWGDVWWASGALKPIEDAEKEPVPAALQPGTQPDGTPGNMPNDIPEDMPQDEQQPRGHTRLHIPYDGDLHRALWQRFERRTSKQESSVANAVTKLFNRQKDSVMDRLKQMGGDAAKDEPFDRAQWVREFRETIRPVLAAIIAEAGQEAVDDLSVDRSLRAGPKQLPLAPFDAGRPEAIQFLEGRAQRFATKVNDTTWNELQASLAQGMLDGETMDQLMDRVISVMGDRIRSTPNTIARTEVIGANNGGTLLAWEQNDNFIEGKIWIAALDTRTRETHIEAHGQEVRLDQDFTVGGAKGQHPGDIGLAEEDINCRCSMVATFKERMYAGSPRLMRN